MFLFAMSLSITGLTQIGVSAECFVPNGTARNDIYDDGRGFTYTPCKSTGHSMCCNLQNGDTCRDDGLCYNPRSDVIWRESCTDSTWQAPECVQLCVDKRPISDADPTYMYGRDVVLTKCQDGSFCCGIDNQAKDCCNKGLGARIVDGKVITNSQRSTGTLTASTASTSTASPESQTISASSSPVDTVTLTVIPTATSTTASADQSRETNTGKNISGRGNNTALVGGAVGGALGGLVLVAGTIRFFLYRRKRNQTVTLKETFEADSKQILEAESYISPYSSQSHTRRSTTMSSSPAPLPVQTERYEMNG